MSFHIVFQVLMIKFNEALQNLDQCIQQNMKYQKMLEKIELKNLILLVSTMDDQNKGYLTIGEVFKNPSRQLQAHMKERLPPHISYINLANYLRKQSNNSSLLTNQYQELNIEAIRKKLENQFMIEKLKQHVLREGAKYIPDIMEGLSEQRLQEYCHFQRLSVHPNILFKTISNGKQKIELEINIQKNEKADNRKGSNQKLDNLKMSLERLKNRVKAFGSEWL